MIIDIIGNLITDFRAARSSRSYITNSRCSCLNNSGDHYLQCFEVSYLALLWYCISLNSRRFQICTGEVDAETVSCLDEVLRLNQIWYMRNGSDWWVLDRVWNFGEHSVNQRHILALGSKCCRLYTCSDLLRASTDFTTPAETQRNKWTHQLKKNQKSTCNVQISCSHTTESMSITSKYHFLEADVVQQFYMSCWAHAHSIYMHKIQSIQSLTPGSVTSSSLDEGCMYISVAPHSSRK